MAAPVDFNGSWKFESVSANFEELLTAMNIGLMKRKTILKTKPEITIKQDGDNFEINTKTSVKTRELKFKVGDEFTDQNPLRSVPSKAVITWEGNVLVQRSVDTDKDPVVSRFIQDGKLIVKQTLGDVEVQRVYHQ